MVAITTKDRNITVIIASNRLLSMLFLPCQFLEFDWVAVDESNNKFQ
jgi:hypothetical protein